MDISAEWVGVAVAVAAAVLPFLINAMKEKPLFPKVSAELLPVFYNVTHPDCAYLVLHVTPGRCALPVVGIRVRCAELLPLTEKPSATPVNPGACRMPRDTTGFFSLECPYIWDTSKESWAAFLVKATDIHASNFSRKIRLVGRWPLTGLTAVAKK